MKKIICLMGSSATGKTALANYMKRYSIPELISTTTRSPRKNESHGKTYYFVDDDAFDEINKVEETEYSGARYCLSKTEVDSELTYNDFVVVIVDREGVEQLKRKYRDMVRVIYLYSTPEEITKRMIKRGDSLEQVGKRLNNAIETGEYKNNYYADHIIRSNDLSLVKKHLKLILRYEGYPWWKILWGEFKYYLKGKLK
ncbi:MAG: hypothetical protein ACOCZ5_01860 [bacterium]